MLSQLPTLITPAPLPYSSIATACLVLSKLNHSFMATTGFQKMQWPHSSESKQVPLHSNPTNRTATVSSALAPVQRDYQLSLRKGKQAKNQSQRPDPV